MSVTKKQGEALIKVLQGYAAWEAQLVNCDDCWKGALPEFDEDLYVEFLRLQKDRIAILTEVAPEQMMLPFGKT